MPEAGVYTYRECIDSALAQMKKTAREVYVEGGHIVIDVKYPYEIPLAECATHAAILDWALHLMAKTWVEKRHVQAFCALAAEHHKINTRLT